jgi:hypothetical protein
VLQPGERATEILACMEGRTHPSSVDEVGDRVEFSFNRADLEYAEARESLEDAQQGCGDSSGEYLRVMDSASDYPSP